MSTLEECRKSFRWEQGVQYQLDICVSMEEFKKQLEKMEKDLERRDSLGYPSYRGSKIFDEDAEKAEGEGVGYPTQVIRPYDASRNES